MSKKTLSAPSLHDLVLQGETKRLREGLRLSTTTNRGSAIANIYSVYADVCEGHTDFVEDRTLDALERISGGEETAVAAILMQRLLYWLDGRGALDRNALPDRLKRGLMYNAADLWGSILGPGANHFEEDHAVELGHQSTHDGTARETALRLFTARLTRVGFRPGLLTRADDENDPLAVEAVNRDVLFGPGEVDDLVHATKDSGNAPFVLHHDDSAALFDPITFWLAMSRLSSVNAEYWHQSEIRFALPGEEVSFLLRHVPNGQASGCTLFLSDILDWYLGKLVPSVVELSTRSESLVHRFAEARLSGYAQRWREAHAPEEEGLPPHDQAALEARGRALLAELRG